MKLKDVAVISVNYRSADFWIIRRGDLKMVGKPVREFSKYHIGVQVVRLDIVVPNYLFYAITHIYNSGAFQAIARGTLRLQHITVEDIENIELEPR